MIAALKAKPGCFDETAAKFNLPVEQVRELWLWYQEHACQSLVLHQNGPMQPEEITPIDKGEGTPLEQLDLIAQNVTQVRFNKRVYSTARSGLYRFILVPEYQHNVIVLNAADRLMPLCSALSALHIHGNRDPQDSNFKVDFKQRLQQQPWISVTCGGIAWVACQLFRELGIKFRQVDLKTLDDLNTYDNGHWMNEVWNEDDKCWMLADLDCGLLFRKKGAWLNLYQFQKQVAGNEKPEFVHLCLKEKCDPFFMDKKASQPFFYSVSLRWAFKDDEAIWRWYRRVAQVVGIADDKAGIISFGPENKIKALYGPANVVSESEWLGRFYS